MAENEISDYFEVAIDNTDIAGITVQENVMKPSDVNNAFRALQGALKRWFKTSLFRLRDSTDQTKLLALDLSGLTTATTRTLVVPNANGTLALISDITVPKGYIFGLALTNNAADAANDIDIGAGEASSSASTPSVMAIASTLTKRYDAVWAVGSAAGGNFAATATDGLKYIFEIKRPDTGVVDVGFSTSETNPTADTNYPAAYTVYRNIGKFTRASSVNGTPVMAASAAVNGQVNFPVTPALSNNPNTLDEYTETASVSPALTSSGGALGAATSAMVQTKIGRVVTITGSVSITNVGTATGNLIVALSYQAGSAAAGSAQEVQATGFGCAAVIASPFTALAIAKYDGTTIMANGRTIVFSCTYQV